MFHHLSDDDLSKAIKALHNTFIAANSRIKTPTSLLDEIRVKFHADVKYELVEENLKECIFTYRVKVDKISADGRGGSKKKS